MIMLINMLANTILKEFIVMILFLQMKMLLKVNKFTKKTKSRFSDASVNVRRWKTALT